MPATDNPSEPISERALSKLKWRCRRGLLENDLFIAPSSNGTRQA